MSTRRRTTTSSRSFKTSFIPGSSSTSSAPASALQTGGQEDDFSYENDVFADEHVDETGLPYWVNKATGEFTWINPDQKPEERDKGETRLAHFDEFVDAAAKVFICGEENDDRCVSLRAHLLQNGVADCWYDVSGELLTTEMTQQRVANCTVFCLVATKSLTQNPRRRYELMIALTAKKPIAFIGDSANRRYAIDYSSFHESLCQMLNQKKKPTLKERDDLKSKLGQVIEYFPLLGAKRHDMLKQILARGRHRIPDPVFEMFRLVEAHVLVIASPINGMAFACEVSTQLCMHGICAQILDIMDDVEGSILHEYTRAVLVCLSDEVFLHGHVGLAVRTARKAKNRNIVCISQPPTNPGAIANQARMKGLDDLARLVLENKVQEVQYAYDGINFSQKFITQLADAIEILPPVRLSVFFDVLGAPIRKARKYVEKSREAVLEDIRNALLQGGRLVILMSPTGSGKSVTLAEFASRTNRVLSMRLQREFLSMPLSVVAVHYFQKNLYASTLIEAAIKSICNQMCGYLPLFRDCLPLEEKAMNDLLKSCKNSDDFLSNLLLQLIIIPSQKYVKPSTIVGPCVVVIDGIDECENPDLLCSMLQKHWEEAPSWLVLLVSCRIQDSIAIVSKKSPLQVKHVKPSVESMKKDLRFVIDHRLREMWGVSERITDGILGRADGSFLWFEFNELPLKIFAEKNCLNLETLLTMPNGLENMFRERFEKLFFSLARQSVAYRAIVSSIFLLPREPVPEECIRFVMKRAVEGNWDLDEYFLRKIRTPCQILGLYNSQTNTYSSPHRAMGDWVSGVGEKSAIQMNAFDLHIEVSKKDHELFAQTCDFILSTAPPQLSWEKPERCTRAAFRFAAKHGGYHWGRAEHVEQATEWFVDFQHLYWNVGFHADESASVDQVIRDGESIIQFVGRSSLYSNFNVDGIRLVVSLLELVRDSVCQNDSRQLAGQVLGRILPARQFLDEQNVRQRSSSILGGIQRRVSEGKMLLGEQTSELTQVVKRRTSGIGKAIGLSSTPSSAQAPGQDKSPVFSLSVPNDSGKLQQQQRKSMVLGPLSGNANRPPLPGSANQQPDASIDRRTNDLLPALQLRNSAMQWVENATQQGHLKVCVPRLWYSDLQPAGGSLIRVQTFSHEINSAFVTRDGTKCVCGLGDGKISVWDLKTGVASDTILDGHPETVFCIALTTNGRKCASGSKDKTIRLWDMESGKLLHILKGHTGWVLGVRWTHDGLFCASCSFDNTVRIWDVGTGKLVRTMDGHGASVNSLELTGDSKILVSACSDKIARLWEVGTGKLLHVLKGHTKEVFACAFYPDGKTVCTGSVDQWIRLWDVISGKCFKTISTPSTIFSVRVSFDEKYVLSAGADRQVHVWDVFDNKEKNTFEGHTHSVLAMSFSGDGRFLVTASKDKSCRQWLFDDSAVAGSLEGHSKSVSAVAVSSDNKYCVTGSLDSTVRVWDLSTGRSIHTLAHPSPITSLATSFDAQYVVVGMQDNTARIWGIFTGKMVCILKGHTQSISCLAVSGDGRICVTGSEDFSARVWEVLSGKILHAFNLPTAVSLVSLSSDNTKLLVKGRFGSKCFDLKTGSEILGSTASALFNVSSLVDGPKRGSMAPDGKRFICEGDVGFTLDEDGIYVDVYNNNVLYGPCGKKFFVWDLLG